LKEWQRWPEDEMQNGTLVFPVSQIACAGGLIGTGRKNQEPWNFRKYENSMVLRLLKNPN